MEIMNILWDSGRGMTTHDIVSHYPEQQPAYTTIATFLKILTTKGFVSYQKAADGGKTHYFSPVISRAEYTSRFMNEVKRTFFGGSLKSLISFFAKEEDISDEDLQEILSHIKSASEQEEPAPVLASAHEQTQPEAEED